ncbi:sensor histidine kinase [Variovorax arabinosiphilus]|uniref:sensor histidine kinase n=1 Tax=Variovorax arabinosiphilus TaxID=3053498 RepID=UPI0025774B60|nr:MULTISPECIES: HAMP domain-containing sensor histidine kinase [unclassified Variovorax]MDM0118799.1 HAMP domain-containing sensor histidine kinase [Variovorax sp. J2L1-78]MDM0129224.1 HAMP domain-containing sensor histidine kinase [Variovorax sp. J2L1-63]MDM0232989.1 HAMP domain-containing sensor histidine kinase [Variovorax sp. J2R1-6]
MTNPLAEPTRFGIRARLLALLLPCVLGLLALDSWNDYRELQGLAQASYDRALLDSAETRRLGATLAPNGTLQRDAATAEARRLREAGAAQREQAESASLRQHLLRDVRMLLVVVVLVWLGVTWSLRPLERLRRSVVHRHGQMPEPLDPSGVPHEVAPLVDAVNQNVAGYRQLLERQSQFLADASHQLRTPLAILMTQAGVALRETDTAQLHDTLRAMVAQIARSRRLCEQLLSLAHATDDAAATEALPLTDLNAVTKDVALQYLTLAHEKDQDLGWVDVQAVPVHADAAELHEVLSNLVHNAIVYTPVGGHITVRAGTTGDMAWAEVSDDGPGIAPARRAEVFERFRQVGDRAGSGARGAGLGLAIARAYARRNGGDIVLADGDAAVDAGGAPTRPPGLRAVVQLPLAAP